MSPVASAQGVTPERFAADVLRNRHNAALLSRWDELGLPDAWLVAGCLFQTVWNLQAGRVPEDQIKDYDLFYFDASELSAEAEQRVQSHVNEVVADLGMIVEAKNQARVHLWYEAWFGFPYSALRNAAEGIDRFLIPATSVGVRPTANGSLEVYAPYGLALLYQGMLQPNPLVPHQPLFEAKARSYQARWAWLSLT